MDYRGAAGASYRGRDGRQHQYGGYPAAGSPPHSHQYSTSPPYGSSSSSPPPAAQYYATSPPYTAASSPPNTSAPSPSRAGIAPVCIVSVMELVVHNGRQPLPCAIMCCVGDVVSGSSSGQMVFHRLLHPGQVPPAFMGQAAWNGAHVHGITRTGESRYSVVLDELGRFVESALHRFPALRPAPNAPLRVFAKVGAFLSLASCCVAGRMLTGQQGPRKVIDSLEWLSREAPKQTVDHHPEHVHQPLGHVRPVEELIESIYESAGRVTPSAAALTKMFPADIVESDEYQSWLCPEHKRIAEEEGASVPRFRCAHADAMSIMETVRREARTVRAR